MKDAPDAEELARQERVCDALMADPEWRQQVADSHAALERALKDGNLDTVDTVDAEGLRALLGLPPTSGTVQTP